ncbi:hypothetical protein UlMin_039088 [Ulmus minor]
MNLISLETRYLNSCTKHAVRPNLAVLSWFSKVNIRSQNEKIKMAISLEQLKDGDISPLVDVLMASESSDIDGVDILCESHSLSNEEYLMDLMRAIDFKLQVVDLREVSLRKESLRDICQGGLACQVLNLRFNHIEKLNMSGNFLRLHTLNLDFCTAITSLQPYCFSCMPNLICLSMCETRITNLWTTSAALSKLPSLKELRFQNCLCCKDTGPCPSSGEEMSYSSEALSTRETVKDFVYLDESISLCEVQRKADSLSNNNEVILSSSLQRIGLVELSTVLPYSDEPEKLQKEIRESDGFVGSKNNQGFNDAAITLKKFISHHPSPICFEKHYREYMIASLLRLEVLDNLPINKIDRVTAKTICAKCFEFLPYERQEKESVVTLLHNRERGATKTRKLNHYHHNQLSFSRSLSAAKLASSEWPLLHRLSNFSHILKEESKRHCPRQFEYHPSDPSLMVFGTLGGEIIAINHENGNTIRYIPSMGEMSSVLGLCWLKKHPSKLVAGSDNGSLRLFDINHASVEFADSSSPNVTFQSFEQLTSLHINSTDDQFLVSGYSKNVALYDISSGRRLQLFTEIHREPINVAKFANHSPFLFATSSFDHDVKMWDLRQNPLRPCFTTSSSRGNVMLCFSPDDLYLLVSAVDNEVKQLLAADGRLHMSFEIASTGSAQNYTRSYYMNGRDYIISGSCDEHVVRICSAQTGKRLKDVYLEDCESGNSMFVQSLRSDPFRDFNMSILAASTRPASKREIIKVNLLASSHHYAEESSYGHFVRTSYGLGG